jgi:class 3 adenylate cyclase/predicted ATPase
LSLRCAACGTVAPLPDQRFCGTCGAPLGPVAAPPRERRIVSILFSDLVGYTAFSETRDHEDVRDVLHQYFTAARATIAAYGGTVEKFIGDAVMAVWGAPVAHEDDAERAVRAALDLTAAVDALATELGILELRVRVGVLTGEAAVDVGGLQQGMVIGDAVNTAARIQSLAAPGTVLVDETTRRASENAISFEFAGAHPVKGKTDLIPTWRPLRLLGRLRGAGRGGAVEPPFVGRVAELETMRAALHAMLVPGAGARLITVTAEAGLGKSRLAWEFEKLADGMATPIRWLRGRSLSFGEGTGFSALAEMLRTQAGIGDEDSELEQWLRVSALLDALFPPGSAEHAGVGRALARLLDLDDRSEPIEQGELFTAWRTLLEAIAVGGTLVLVFEELQLADQAQLSFLAHVIEWCVAVPILILALSRPDDRIDPLAGEHDRVRLTSLSPAEMDELIRGAVRDAPTALLGAVRAEGGGVPLYAVESLRALSDQGVLAAEGEQYVVRGAVQEVEVPPTLRALIASRLDRLDEPERRLLAAGAVFGERFPASGVASLLDTGEVEAQTVLGGLTGKAMLRLERDPQSPSRVRYEFQEGVVRRVVLTMLSRRDRRRLHLAAADHLLRAQGDAERAAPLAGHLLAALQAVPTAGDAPVVRRRALAALDDAAQRAAAVASLAEALEFYDRAIELEERELERTGLMEQAGAVAIRAGNGPVAADRYRQAGEAHAAAGRERPRLGARIHELRALRYIRSPAEILTPLREVDAALRGERDAVAALAAAVLSFTLYQNGEHAEALAIAERAVEVARACQAHGEHLQALGAQGSALAELGRPEEAIEVYTRALSLAREHDSRRALQLTGNLALSLVSVGRFREAVQGARDTIDGARQLGERFVERWASLVAGRALCSLGKWDTAIVEIEAVMADVAPFHLGMATAPLAVIALARGDDLRARELVKEHDRRCGEDNVAFASDFRCLRAAILADVGQDRAALAAVIPQAEAADFAEWPGWLAPVIDRLLAQPDDAPLLAARAALDPAAILRHTPPVQAQADRLGAHLALRAGDRTAAEEFWASAEQLAGDCGLVFERAVIALERAEAGATPGRHGWSAAEAGDVFEWLAAAPWSARTRALTGGG